MVTEDTDAEPYPGRWRGLAVCLLAGFMTLLDVSIVNVALPSIRTGLHAPAEELQWVVSGYALTFGLALVPAGRLGDRYGRRRLFLIGLTIFMVTSAACASALTGSWLVAARLAQGIGGGMISPQISGLIQQMFQRRERARAFGFFGTTIGVSTAIGPLLGGVLLQLVGVDHGWRLVFLINLPVGLAALLARRHLPANQPGERQDLDPLGVLLFTAAAALVLVPIVDAGGLWLLLVPAALAGGLLVFWERHQHRAGRLPLIDSRLFRRRGYALGSALILMYFTGFTPLFFVLTVYLQTGKNYGPLAAGLATLPFAVGTACGSLFSGRVTNRLGRWVVVGGQLVVILGLLGAMLAVLRHNGPDVGLWMAIPLFVGGVGGGFVIAPNQALSLAEIPVAQGSAAGGLLQTAQRLGAALGTAVVISVFFATLSDSHNYADAFVTGLTCSVVFVAVATALSAVDLGIRIRHTRRLRRQELAHR
ncbi:MAG: MFS transporter [Actinocatenispora sp.]